MGSARSTRRMIAADELVHDLRHLMRGFREELLHRDEERWVADDPRLAVHHVRELREGVHAVPGARLRKALLRLLDLLRTELFQHLGELLLDVQSRVPHRQIRHRGELPYRVAIATRRGDHDLAALCLREAVFSRSDHQARREALHVPLPGRRQRLVEIVHIEHQAPLRRPEDAEVREMSITARLDVEAGPRRCGQIRRHDQRPAAIEGERRHEHPPVANGYQVRHSKLLLAPQQLNGIGPVCRRLEHAMP